MKTISFIKSVLQDIPKPIGIVISKIPYDKRPLLGKKYKDSMLLIREFENHSVGSKKDFIVFKMRDIVKYAMQIPFYKELYENHKICYKDINTFEDISSLPIITKSMLREYSLENRSKDVKGRYVVNTGGSSGSTLDFYILPSHIPNEWAHMHTIWDKYNYDVSKLKFTFSGRNLGKKNLRYDGLRHQYTINVYNNYQNMIPELKKICKNNKISYLHGYPSALAEFADYLYDNAPELVENLSKTLEGAFFSSEYPAKVYRSKVESVFNIPTVSWYGHTERAILAWEKKEQFVYYPFHTYGLCETIKNDVTGGYNLVGTSFHNYASPFIRYDTEDDVDPVIMKENLLESFKVRDGRIGEFVLDQNGKKIPLTALIFGRHHKIFNIAKHIQVYQKDCGEMTVLATLKDKLPEKFKFEDWFDSKGLNMAIGFKLLDKPKLTSSGKVTLKVKSI